MYLTVLKPSGRETCPVTCRSSQSTDISGNPFLMRLHTVAMAFAGNIDLTMATLFANMVR